MKYGKVDSILHRLQQQQVKLLCIGASAGALDMLNQLLPVVAGSTPMALIVLVHLPADRDSLLVSLFQSRCTVRVEEAIDKLPIRPAHIYFAPPAYHLLVERSFEFSLSLEAPVHFSRPSIDVLFETAADAFGSQAMGLVLTGANQDGALGLRAVYQHGGVAAVQRPREASSAMMPESALAACPAAFSLSNRELIELFARL